MKISLLIWLTSCLALSAGTLTFDAKEKEVACDVDSTQASADFTFKNESSETVVISRYDATCSCIDAKIKGSKFVYEPGETGVIRANFDTSNFTGAVDKTVAVWLKGDPESKPSIVLTTRVTIPVLVEVSPKSLIWELGGEADPKTVTIEMNHSEPIHIKSVSGADGRFIQELKTIEDGKKYEVTVTPANTDKVGMGVIHIETDCAITRHRSHRIFMVVRKELPKAPQANVEK